MKCPKQPAAPYRFLPTTITLTTNARSSSISRSSVLEGAASAQCSITNRAVANNRCLILTADKSVPVSVSSSKHTPFSVFSGCAVHRGAQVGEKGRMLRDSYTGVDPLNHVTFPDASNVFQTLCFTSYICIHLASWSYALHTTKAFMIP